MNKYQSKKTELTEQRAAMLKEIEVLSGRRKALNGDHAKTRAEVDRLQQAITDALIAGTDPTKAQSQLQTEQAKFGSFEMAITQAEKRLTELNSQADQAQHNAYTMELFQDGEIMETQLLDALDTLESVAKKILSIADSNHVLSRNGLNPDAYDHIRVLRQICDGLSQKVGGGAGGILYYIDDLKRSYKLFFDGRYKE